MLEISKIFIEAEVEVTDEMKKYVENIGKNFELFRDKFNKDSVDKTSAALDDLYKIFEVEPVKRKVVYDGKALINVTTKRWQDQHQELWELLVPGVGQANTVQGEVIRITGKVTDELYRNGGCNWDKQYQKMLDGLLSYCKMGAPLEPNVLKEAKTLVKEIYKGDNCDSIKTYRLTEIGVSWVLKNPNPIALEKTKYKR